MNKMKKFMSLLMAAVMVLSVMTVNVFAEDTATGEGSITITEAKDNETYSLYRIFDLTLGADNTSYSYKVTEAWEDFFAEGAKGAEYVTLDDNGYVAISTGLTDANAAAFAEFAAIYAANLEANKTGSVGEDGFRGEFDDLPLGYYLVHSTYGSSGICALTTTDKDAEVDEKNIQPGIVKLVKENEDDTWGKANDAQRGEEVDFQITVTVEENAAGYVVTDELPEGMTMTTEATADETPDYTDSIKITHKGSDVTTADAITATAMGFTVDFDKLNIETTKNDTFIIEYTAVVDGNASMNTALENEAKLTYDDDVEVKATTNTYTWKLPVFKFTGDDKPLEDAKFVLKKEVETDVFEYYKNVDGVVSWVEDKDEATELTSEDDGYLYFEGLDSGEYLLEETEAPDGYNMLTDDVEVAITVTRNDDGTITLEDPKVKVENNTGVELPGTGGIGTTIFYAAGGMMVIGAAAMLIRRRYN